MPSEISTKNCFLRFSPSRLSPAISVNTSPTSASSSAVSSPNTSGYVLSVLESNHGGAPVRLKPVLFRPGKDMNIAEVHKCQIIYTRKAELFPVHRVVIVFQTFGTYGRFFFLQTCVLRYYFSRFYGWRGGIGFATQRLRSSTRHRYPLKDLQCAITTDHPRAPPPHERK